MSDTTDSLILDQCFQSSVFMNRVRMRFINAAVSIVNGSTAEASHVQRVAFAGALFAGDVDPVMLTMSIISNPTIRTSVLADRTLPGGNVLDSDIDFQVGSVFTGIATARSWT